MKYGWLALAIILLVACTPTLDLVATSTPLPPQQTPQTLSIAAADTVAPALQTLISVYQQKTPTVQIHLIERADHLAVQALEQGDVDLIASLGWSGKSWDTAWATPFARDGLAIIVHPQNGLPGVTLKQLRQLFQGQVENLESWGGLPGAPQIVSREEAAGEFSLFQTMVMQDARVTSTAMLAPGSDAVLELVGNDPVAIGYLSAARVTDRVRSLAIEEVPPAPEAVASDIYPLTYEVFWVAPNEPQGVARDFVQWVLAPEGQGVIAGQGLLPISP